MLVLSTLVFDFVWEEDLKELDIKILHQLPHYKNKRISFLKFTWFQI